MVKEAESNAERDKQERERIDVKNQADQIIYQTEKTLSEAGDKIPLDDKNKIQSAIDDLRKKLKGDDVGAIKASMDALMKASHKMAEEMYKNAGGQAQGGPQGQTGPQGQAGPQENQDNQQKKDGKGDGPVDADFTVVDDK
jgi:molecular chaperone DnaK